MPHADDPNVDPRPETRVDPHACMTCATTVTPVYQARGAMPLEGGTWTWTTTVVCANCGSVCIVLDAEE